MLSLIIYIWARFNNSITKLKKAMRKILLVAVLSIVFLMPTQETKAQVRDGSCIFDLYYGYSLSNSLLKNWIKDDITDVGFGSIGPVGARFEYLVMDKVGIGVDVIYRSSYAEYDDFVGTAKYTYRYDVVQFRAMGKVTVHFLSDENADLYGGIGVGYRYVNRKATATDPNYMPTVQEGYFPVAARLSLGFRYLFTPNFGANAELGIGGGSFVNAGLSYVF